MKKLALTFIDPDLSRGSRAGFRWLGVFVHSQGDRVLFFPGYAQEHYGFCIFRGGHAQNHNFQIDHISIGKAFRDVHVTGLQRRAHESTGKPKSLGEGRYLCFGLSVNSFDYLRTAMSKTVIKMPAHQSDIERRTTCLASVREGSGQQDIQECFVRLDPKARTLFADGFFHAAGIVGQRAFPQYEGSELGLPPYGPPFLKTAVTEMPKLPLVSQRLPLSQDIDTQLVSA